MRRKLVAIGLAIVAPLMVAGFASGSADIQAPQTMHLTVVFEQATLVDADPSGPSLGDQQVGSGVIRHNGSKVGDFALTCTVDAVGSGGHWGGTCNGWGKFADGYVTFGGETGGNNRHTFAVTGGSGSYRNARGQLHVTDLSQKKSRVVLELIP